MTFMLYVVMVMQYQIGREKRTGALKETGYDRTRCGENETSQRKIV